MPPAEGAGAGVAIRIAGDSKGQANTVGFISRDHEARVQAILKQRGNVQVRLVPAEEGDVEGHVLATNESAVVARLGLDDDDVEGHAISIHFPNAEEARQFRMRLLAAGALTASIALGTGAAIALGPGLQGDASGAAAGQASQVSTSAQIREGGAVSTAGQASQVGTAAQIREGGALSAGAGEASSIDTAAQIREGGALSSATGGGATDTAAQIREGGSADEEEVTPRNIPEGP